MQFQRLRDCDTCSSSANHPHGLDLSRVGNSPQKCHQRAFFIETARAPPLQTPSTRLLSAFLSRLAFSTKFVQRGFGEWAIAHGCCPQAAFLASQAPPMALKPDRQGRQYQTPMHGSKGTSSRRQQVHHLHSWRITVVIILPRSLLEQKLLGFLYCRGKNQVRVSCYAAPKTTTVARNNSCEDRQAERNHAAPLAAPQARLSFFSIFGRGGLQGACGSACGADGGGGWRGGRRPAILVVTGSDLGSDR